MKINRKSSSVPLNAHALAQEAAKRKLVHAHGAHNQQAFTQAQTERVKASPIGHPLGHAHFPRIEISPAQREQHQIQHRQRAAAYEHKLRGYEQPAVHQAPLAHLANLQRFGLAQLRAMPSRVQLSQLHRPPMPHGAPPPRPIQPPQLVQPPVPQVSAAARVDIAQRKAEQAKRRAGWKARKLNMKRAKQGLAPLS